MFCKDCGKVLDAEKPVQDLVASKVITHNNYYEVTYYLCRDCEEKISLKERHPANRLTSEKRAYEREEIHQWVKRNYPEKLEGQYHWEDVLLRILEEDRDIIEMLKKDMNELKELKDNGPTAKNWEEKVEENKKLKKEIEELTEDNIKARSVWKNNPYKIGDSLTLFIEQNFSYDATKSWDEIIWELLKEHKTLLVSKDKEFPMMTQQFFNCVAELEEKLKRTESKLKASMEEILK